MFCLLIQVQEGTEVLLGIRAAWSDREWTRKLEYHFTEDSRHKRFFVHSSYKKTDGVIATKIYVIVILIIAS